MKALLLGNERLMGDFDWNAKYQSVISKGGSLLAKLKLVCHNYRYNLLFGLQDR